VPHVTAIDFYFDPACPWTWITSRWLSEVAPRRDLDVTWRTFSLMVRNRDRVASGEWAAIAASQFRSLRVIEAARSAHGDGAVGPLYTQLGARVHHDGDVMLAGLAEAIEAAGLPPDLVSAADDESWDAAIVASTEAGWKLVGDDVGIPIIVVAGNASTFFGPVMSPAPTGDAAVALWDAYSALGRFDGVFEIKRSRSVGPQFAARP